MRSHGWPLSVFRVSLLIASLPLFVYAQDDVAIKSSTETSLLGNTTTLASSQDITTSTDFPTQSGRTSTELSVTLISETSPTSINGSSTTSSDTLVTTTSTDIPVDSTSSTIPIGSITTIVPIDATTSTDSPVDSTTSTVPIDSTTSTDILLDSTTSTGRPANSTTSTGLPVDTTTSTEQPVSTSTNTSVPVDTTTTTNQSTDETTATTTISTTGSSSSTVTDGQPTTAFQPTITKPPASTTTADASATSAVSSVSAEILGLIPIINSWKDNPESLKDETKNKVDDVHDHIVAVVTSLGGDPDQGCAGKRKRGLLGFIGDVINGLVCIAKDLTDTSVDIVGGNVAGVTRAINSVQTKAEKLTDNQDNDDDNKTDDKTDQDSTKRSTESTSTTKESSSTTSSSSCTTDTAQHITIVCKPTSITEGGNVRTTETCFDTITVQVTGCSVTQSTTVVSTSSTAAAITPCASGSCGGACPINDAPLSGAPMAGTSTKVDCARLSTITTNAAIPTGKNARALPNARVARTSAEDRGLNRRVFADNTTPNPVYIGSLNPAWVSQAGDTSGHWYDFPAAGQGAAGVNGIYGCTAVIIASDKGVYLSHIWENPVFIDQAWQPTDDASFRTKTFEAFRDGTPNAQSVAALVGSDANPGVLHASNHPRIFVVTPFTTPGNDPTGTTTLYRYQDRAQWLADQLAGIVPGSTKGLWGYIRTDAAQSTDPTGYWGRAVLEVDMLQDVVVTPTDSPVGSWAFEGGRWRLWVEDAMVASNDFIVAGSGVQLSFPTTQNPVASQSAGSAQPRRKRQDSPLQECLALSRASTTSDASSAVTKETTETTSSTEVTQTPSIASTTRTETSQNVTDSYPPPTTLRTSTLTSKPVLSSTSPDRKPTATTTATATTTTAAEPSFTGPYLCFNHGGPRVPTPYCQCETTTAGQTFFATAPAVLGQCTQYTTFPSAVTLRTPTKTTQSPPKPTATNPNAGVPKVECAKPGDCGEWKGRCDFGPAFNEVVCLATDWHTVDGVPTSERAICECLVDEVPVS